MLAHVVCTVPGTRANVHCSGRQTSISKPCCQTPSLRAAHSTGFMLVQSDSAYNTQQLSSRRYVSANLKGQPRMRVCRRRSTATRCDDGDDPLEFERQLKIGQLSLFPLRSVLMPSGRGTVHVHEERYLSMFRTLLGAPEAKDGAPVLFGHILNPSALPGGIGGEMNGGLPAVGCAARVRAVHHREDGGMDIEYEALRRFKTMSIKANPVYTTALVQYFEDDALDAADRHDVRLLERQLWSALREITRLTSRIYGDMGGHLPDYLCQLAPPPEEDVSLTAMYNPNQPGKQAGHAIHTWRQASNLQKKSSHQDPYIKSLEKYCKHERQEKFSFAAAALLDLGLLEKTALLQSRCTSGRLEWILNACLPHLKELQAHAAAVDAVRKD